MIESSRAIRTHWFTTVDHPILFVLFLLLSETVVLTRGTRTAESSCAMSLVVTWQEAKERESGNEASDFYFQVIFYLQRLPFVLQQGTSKPQTKKVVISFITIMTRYVQNTLARTHARKRRRVFFNGIENDNRRRFTHSRLIYGREALTSRHTTRFDCFTWTATPLFTGPLLKSYVGHNSRLDIMWHHFHI